MDEFIHRNWRHDVMDAFPGWHQTCISARQELLGYLFGRIIPTAPLVIESMALGKLKRKHVSGTN